MKLLKATTSWNWRGTVHLWPKEECSFAEVRSLCGAVAFVSDMETDVRGLPRCKKCERIKPHARSKENG